MLFCVHKLLVHNTYRMPNKLTKVQLQHHTISLDVYSHSWIGGLPWLKCTRKGESLPRGLEYCSENKWLSFISILYIDDGIKTSSSKMKHGQCPIFNEGQFFKFYSSNSVLFPSWSKLWRHYNERHSDMLTLWQKTRWSYPGKIKKCVRDGWHVY